MRLRILQEPTFYFLLIAAAVSVIYWLFNNDSGQLLQIDREEIEARILVAELTQGYPADAEQRAEIERTVIDDTVLVLEAYATGLQNDARINDILAQKMRHVLSGNVIQPQPEELSAFYNDNIELYREPARLTATELVLIGPDPADALLQAQLESGTDPEALATERNRMVGTLPRVTRRDLQTLFDTDFADQVFEADPGAWSGPFASNRGQHYLRVSEQFPPTTPPLEQVLDQVRLDWIATEEEARLQEEVTRLRGRYDIQIIERTP